MHTNNIKPNFSKLIPVGLGSTLTLLLSSALYGQGLTSGNITLIPNSDDPSATATELVTMGVPFAPCTLTSSSPFTEFTLWDAADSGGSEVSVYVQETLTWPSQAPCGTTSVRALKVQFQIDATAGTQTYSWDLTGRTVADFGGGAVNLVNEVAHVNKLDPDGATVNKDGVMAPAVFAIHDPAYLLQTKIIPPSAPRDNAFSYDANYYENKFEADARYFSYQGSTAANWLFDRTSAVYRQAIRRGELEHYREAYLSHEFYIDKIEDNTGASQDNCTGGFNYDGKASVTLLCDDKYIYTEPVKLHLAITGDDSWLPDTNLYANTRTDMWNQMADILFRGDNRAISSRGAVPQPGFSEAYDDIADGYTERKSGFGLQAIVNSCQLTLNSTICGFADTVIDNMYDHKVNNPEDTTPYSIANQANPFAYGGGDTGYLSHSWDLHEGRPPWVGTIASITGPTVVIDNAIGDATKLPIGDTLRIFSHPFSSDNDYTVVSSVNSGPGQWTVVVNTTPTGVNSFVGQTVYAPATRELEGDRAFSPWMLSIIADGIWQYYNWTGDATRKEKARQLLLGFAQAYTSQALDGFRMQASTKTAIEGAFGVTVLNSSPALTTGCGLTVAPFPRYAANVFSNSATSNADYVNYLSGDSRTDQHITEGLFVVSLGIFFETDAAKKAAMEAVAADMQDWFDNWSCTSGNQFNTPAGLGDPLRAFAWQNKSDPFGTYRYAKSFAITYDSDTFIESLANDGTISNNLTLTLGGAKFSRSSGNFVASTDYTISGLPPGFTGATLTATSDSTATLTLNGAATDHLQSDDVSNITLTFLDAAFADGFEAARVGNFAKSDLATQFRNPELIYVNDTFNEVVANDGSIANTVVINLTDDTFAVSGGNLTSPTHYSVSNLPTGLVPQIAIDGDGDQATVSFTGNAGPHTNGADEANFGITFTDAAFTTSVAAGVTNSSKTDLSVLFFEPALAYSASVFTEDAGANDGSISNSLTITLSDDTFAVPGGAMTAGVHYNVAEIPTGLTAVITGTSTTTATLTLTGNAASHTNGDEAADADLTVNFLPAAFVTTTDVSNITNASKSDLSVSYVEPALLYGSMIFNENATLNDGSISNNVTINLSDDTFVVSGGVMALGVHYIVSNVPSGLTAVVTGTSATTATLALTGNAASHANGADEISNLTLIFLPAAFTTSTSVTNIAEANKSNLQILNVEPSIAYSMGTFSEDPASNDGSITDTLVLTLTDDLFVNAGGTLTSPTHYLATNVPTGLTLAVNVNGGGTAITLSLTGMAAAHVDASDVTDFSFTLLPAAFVTTTNTANVTNVAKTDIGVDFLEQGISYDFNTFVEANANDGSTATVLNLSLVAETFVVAAGAMTPATHYTVANVPAGLTAVVTGTSANSATLALTGNAAASSAADDVSDLTLTFLNAAFTGGDASAITNASKSDLAIDFLDAILSYGSTTFTEAGADDGSIANTLALTLTVDSFTVPAGAMTPTTHYTVANVPSGLTAVVTGTSTSTATVALTGNADDHANANDVANLTLTFANGAFTNGDASQVSGSSNAAIVVNFNDPASSGGGGGGSSSTSGTVTNLSVDEGASITNSGTLVDLTNSGTVTGGTVSGTVTNSAAASLVDVQLAPGTVVSGGTVRGRLSGTGTLVGTVVDASFVAGAVKIGAGSKVTANTASSVGGLVLTDAIRGENGIVQLSNPLLVDENNNDVSALQIAAQQIDQLFGSSTTQTGDSTDDGLVVISNEGLGGSVVPVTPQKVETTTEPNGVTLNNRGELVIVGQGIKTTFAPTAADLEGFQAGIAASGANLNLLSDGLVFVELNGDTISLHFSLVTSPPTSTSGLSSTRALSSGATSFSVTGSPADPASYRVLTHYADGSMQELLPAVHDITAFDVWMSSAGYSTVIDGLTGFISVFDESEVMIWRGIPDYSLLPPDSSAGSSVDFSAATDLNGDGIGDIYFHTEQWTQVLYGLPQ